MALSIYQLPGSNALKTAKGVYAKMEELKRRFPEGLDYQIVYDTTPFIRESIVEVFKTLRDAIILVALVVLVFLQNWRATLIPLIAVPVAIVGTFAVMAALGFQPEQPVAVRPGAGHRHRGRRRDRGGRERRALAGTGAVAARGGAQGDGRSHRAGGRRGAGAVRRVRSLRVHHRASPGQFFRQFAVTIAVSTVISAFNSLTLSPALAAILLKPHGAKRDPLTWLLDMRLGWFFTAVQLGLRGSARASTPGSSACCCGSSLIALLVYGGLLYLHLLGVHPRADRLHSRAGQGLPAGQRAVARLRVGATHAGGDGPDRRRSPARRRAWPTRWGSPASRCSRTPTPRTSARCTSCSTSSTSGAAPGCRRTPSPPSCGKLAGSEIRDALVSVFGAPPIDGLGTPAVSSS